MKNLFKGNKKNKDTMTELCTKALNGVDEFTLRHVKIKNNKRPKFEITTVSTLDGKGYKKYPSIKLTTEAHKIVRDIISKIQRSGVMTYANQNSIDYELNICIHESRCDDEYGIDKYGNKIFTKTVWVYTFTGYDLSLIDITEKNIKFNDFRKYFSQTEVPYEPDGYTITSDETCPGNISGFFIEIGEADDYDFQGFIPEKPTINEFKNLMYDTEVASKNKQIIIDFLKSKVEQILDDELTLTEYELTDLFEKAGITELSILPETAEK